MARNTGGPAVLLVQGTIAMGASVDNTVYCADAAGPASSEKFTRLRGDDLPSGADKIDLRVFATRRPYSFAYSPSLLRALGPEIAKADLVEIHSLNLFPQLAAYMRARHADTPYIVTPHGALDPWLRSNSRRRKAVINRLWQTNMLEHAAAIHFTTDDEASLARDIAPSVPRHVVPYGIKTEELRDLPDARGFRTRFLDGHSGAVILFLGRIARKKGIDVLLSAFARVPDSADAMLVVVGPDGEGLESDLQRQAVIEGTSPRVRFLGPLYGEDRRAALGAADIWVLTSHTENFGIAVLEAMAAGIPVIISAAVNTSPAIQAAKAGIVTSLEIGEVAHHLATLLKDPARRRQFGIRGRAFAEQYDWAEVAPRLVQMYVTVIDACAANRRDSGGETAARFAASASGNGSSVRR